jgi:glycogen operon protein
MTAADWNDGLNYVLGMLVRGEATDEVDERGRRLLGEAVLLLVNGGARSRQFALPSLDRPGTWTEIINTAHPHARPVRQNRVNLVAHSLMLLRHEAPR